MLERGLLVLLWLMPFVRLEPAPVDFLIWAMGGYLLLREPQAYWRALPPLARSGVLLMIAAHVSIAWAPDLGRAIFYALATLEMFVLLVLFAHGSRTVQSWRRLTWAYLGGGTLAAALGVLAYFGVLPYREIFLFGDPRRAMALFKDPNVFGAYLVPAVILLWALVGAEPRSSPRRLWIEGGMAFLLTSGIVLSGSRTAWGGLILGLGLYLLLILKRRGWRELQSGWALGIGMALAIALAFHPQVLPMLKERAVLIKPYDHDRFAAQERALLTPLRSDRVSDAVSHSALGTAPGQSEVVLQYATHNLYLRVLYELGVTGMLGLGLLLIATGAYLKRGLHRREWWGAALLATVSALLAMSFFIDSLHWRHLFVFLGLALSASEKAGQQANSAFKGNSHI